DLSEPAAVDLTERVPEDEERRIVDGEPPDHGAVGPLLALPLLLRGEDLVDRLKSLEGAEARRRLGRSAGEEGVARALQVLQRPRVVGELEAADVRGGEVVERAPGRFALERNEARDGVERGPPLAELRLEIEELLQRAVVRRVELDGGEVK